MSLEPLRQVLADRTDDPGWWPAAHQRVLAGSLVLRQAQHPGALEQATAELIGAELYDAVSEQRQGRRFEVWATQLIGRAADRVIAETDRGGEWQGPWRLLHGMASIGPFGLDYWATESAARAARAVPAAALGSEPAWLQSMPHIKPAGTIHVLCGAQGTRHGVIAEFRYPGDGSSQWYLLDIGTTPALGLITGGAFATPELAAAAWRQETGESSPLTPVTDQALACLVQCGQDEPDFIGDQSRTVMDNWFRAPRRVTDLLDHLPAR
jgi:hypothetical protein